MLIDSHIHLDDPRFDPDRQTLLSNARQAGVAAWVVPAISARFWPRLSAVCASCPDTYATYGIHPLFLADYQSAHLQQLEDLLNNRQGVTAEPAYAVGECGLDYYQVKDRESAGHRLQKTVFASQLQLAKAANLPIIIHARGAVEDVILMIRDSGHRNGVVHSYNGSYEQAKRLIDLGYSLGFGGAVTYTRASRLRKLVTQLPMDALLVETDAPDQSDAGLNDTGLNNTNLNNNDQDSVRQPPTRNLPDRLPAITQVIASLKGMDADAFNDATSLNAIKRFNLTIPTVPAA